MVLHEFLWVKLSKSNLVKLVNKPPLGVSSRAFRESFAIFIKDLRCDFFVKIVIIKTFLGFN
jgi:hypothetical protein